MSAMVTGGSDDIHAKCDGPGCSKPSINRCGGCGVTRYCSKECQLKDWKNAANPQKAACKIFKGYDKVTCTSSSSSPSASAGAFLRRADASRSVKWEKMIRIGSTLYDQGNYDKAMEVYHRCLSDFANVDDADCLRNTFSRMGHTYLAQRELAKVIVFYEKGTIH